MHLNGWKKNAIRLGSLGLLVALNFGAAAQEIELPELVVYDFPDSSVAGREATSSVTIIDRDEIERSGASDVYGLISGRVPGVFVDKHGIFNYGIGTGAAGQISIRGLGGMSEPKVLVLVDGQPTKMGIFGHAIADAYPLEEVERVEVLRGSHSLHYGDLALGGVVNIVTRRLPEEEGISTRVSGGGGEFHSYKAALENSGRFGRFSYFASVLRRETEGHRPNSAFRGWNGYAKTGYHISDNWQVVLNGWGIDLEVQDPGTVFNPQTQDTRDVRRGGAGVTLYDNYGTTRGALTLYGQWGEHDFSGYDGWKSTDRTIGASAYQLLELFENNRLEVGGDIQQSGGEGKNVESDTDFGRYFNTAGGIYLDDEQVLNEVLTLQAGLRLQMAEHNPEEWIPRLGARYQLFPETVLHGQAARGYRAPTVRDLYFFPPSSLDLKPEEAWSYELGIRQACGSCLFLDLTGFYIDADNLIIYQFPEARNSGALINKGVELAGVFTPCDWFELLLSYTYLDQNKRVEGLAESVINWTNRFIWRGMTLQSTTAIVDNLRFSDRKEKYAVTDVKLSYLVGEFATVALKISNVFNQSYEMVEGYPLPGRWLWGEASFNF